MPLTNDQLSNLPFGYLNGDDLTEYCPFQLLIKQYEVKPSSLKKGCDIAYSELISLLNTRYALDVEFSKRGFTNAAATATVNAGSISGINITYGGTNYGTAPAVIISGSGTGAEAEAIVENGIVTGINILSGGTGYNTVPIITLSGGEAADSRTLIFVKLSAICAIRNILGNATNTGEQMKTNFEWADNTIRALRNAQQGLPTVNQSPITTYGSPAEVVPASFLTLG